MALSAPMKNLHSVVLCGRVLVGTIDFMVNNVRNGKVYSYEEPSVWPDLDGGIGNKVATHETCFWITRMLAYLQ